MLFQKTNPTGIDTQIAKIQKAVFNRLTNVNGWTLYDSFERVYLNPYHETGTLIPELYKGNREYREIYFNDNVNAESYFVINQNRTYNEKFETNISYIFQVNLEKLYPAIEHRADEEAHRDVFFGIQEVLSSDDILGIKTGVRNVYEGLNIDQNRLDDMQPCHVFKFDLKIIHEFECCC